MTLISVFSSFCRTQICPEAYSSKTLKPHNSNIKPQKMYKWWTAKMSPLCKEAFHLICNWFSRGGTHTHIHTRMSSLLAFHCPVKVIDGEFCCLLMHTADKLSLSDCAVWFVRDGARQNELAAQTEGGLQRLRQKLVRKDLFEENYISEGLKATGVQMSCF